MDTRWHIKRSFIELTGGKQRFLRWQTACLYFSAFIGFLSLWSYHRNPQITKQQFLQKAFQFSCEITPLLSSQLNIKVLTNQMTFTLTRTVAFWQAACKYFHSHVTEFTKVLNFVFRCHALRYPLLSRLSIYCFWVVAYCSMFMAAHFNPSPEWNHSKTRRTVIFDASLRGSLLLNCWRVWPKWGGGTTSQVLLVIHVFTISLTQFPFGHSVV